MRVNFFVDGQRLEIEKSIVAEQTIDFITAHVDFSSEWDGLQKFIHFSKGNEKYSFPLDENGNLTADQGCNLLRGLWHVYLHGNRYDDSGEEREVVSRVTTTEVLLYVQNNGIDGTEPFPEIADISQQLITQAQEYLVEAQELRTSVTDLVNELMTKSYTWNDLKGVHE